MRTVSKPSGEKATASIKDRFWSARTQLTLTYTAILAVILFVSSSFIYTAFSRQLMLRFERFPQGRPPAILQDGVIPPRPEEVLRDLMDALTLVNGLLLVLASITSYWLAGATLEPIRKAYERQRRFLSDASHELRTPVAILHADLENTLPDKATPPSLREQARSHLEETQRMTQIIKDLLLLSHLDETPTKRESTQATDLIPLLESIAQRFQPLAKQRDITLSVTTQLTSCTLNIQTELLKQAIENLVKNAIAYNVPSGRVTITCEKDRSQARIEVRDTGIGIAKEHLDKVFDRFYRVDKSRSRETGGSGLGLSITHSIIQQFGGSIEIKSIFQKGTTVTILLPISRAS